MIENWIETRSGIKFEFLDPKEDQISIDDIAYSLSNQCRYNGHCSKFYSVAEHSIFVSQLVPEEQRLAALLHDAAEAYLSDIPSPIKQFMPEYKKLESVVEEAIMKKFGVKVWDTDEIRHADRLQLTTEAFYLIPSQGKDWVYTQNMNIMDGIKPICAPPSPAYVAFLRAFRAYTDKEKPKLVLV